MDGMVSGNASLQDEGRGCVIFRWAAVTSYECE